MVPIILAVSIIVRNSRILTLLHLTRPKPARPHLFNPAETTHTCIQISRTYYSSTDDRQPRETWRSNEK
jgi:hypothetical protein